MPNEFFWRIEVPIRLVSEANQREHWATRNKRKRAQQRAVELAWLAAGMRGRFHAFPYVIELVRVGVRKLDPDNLAGSFKHAQDQIARCLGVDDGDEKRVRWIYSQRKGAPKQYALEILIHESD